MTITMSPFPSHIYFTLMCNSYNTCQRIALKTRVKIPNNTIIVIHPPIKVVTTSFPFSGYLIYPSLVIDMPYSIKVQRFFQYVRNVYFMGKALKSFRDIFHIFVMDIVGVTRPFSHPSISSMTSSNIYTIPQRILSVSFQIISTSCSCCFLSMFISIGPISTVCPALPLEITVTIFHPLCLRMPLAAHTLRGTPS